MFAPYLVDTWEVATIVAVVAGVVGFFTVLRGASFAAHALPNGAFAGAAGASLVGASPLVGLGLFSALGALAIAGLGRRARSDVATALTIVLMLGLGALFLAQAKLYASSVFALLFGEALGIPVTYLVPTAVLAAVSLVAVGVLFRPLLLSSVAPDAAEARGVSPRAMDLAFLGVVALVTTMAVPVVGTLLVFSLLVSPAATARVLTRSPHGAVVASVVLALATVWSSIALSYALNLPLGVLVGGLGLVAYVGARGLVAARRSVLGRHDR